ncbi:hypothetical protein M2401_003678 [Pseudomonas sp. JUb42]|uniref:hypothetical protein n=1 Tax=Pseudomonas sp. JUb42 TaxID=2940611 RepID=UPI002169760D|nr:hypothetical protein [Pseudomonas sp. JUb42]MCS3469938.1 hypothetical protein [Pseudomonas sp. JUb42]
MTLMLALDTLESVKRSAQSALLCQQLAIQAGTLQGDEPRQLLDEITWSSCEKLKFKRLIISECMLR